MKLLEGIPYELVLWLGSYVGILALLIFIATGCTSSTCVTVGECVMLPELSDLTSAASCRIYTSINGARLICPTNSAVKVTYRSASTNRYFGIVDRNEQMVVDLTIDAK